MNPYFQKTGSAFCSTPSRLNFLGRPITDYILFETVEAVLGEVDPGLVGVKISPTLESGPMAAHDETLPVAEYAIRKLGGYGLSHLLLMGNTTDFTGTPLEPLIGDGNVPAFISSSAAKKFN